ncbi:hypothetical protein F66182_5286 [Fusarium sp. NRRL 66182]|nr:hypothetical protein F66182_5286 [Fusarium sp. NRRL 66182]
MKPVYALTLCLSSTILEGTDAFVLPGFAAPKSGYALVRPDAAVSPQYKKPEVAKPAVKSTFVNPNNKANVAKPDSKTKTEPVLPAFKPKGGFAKPTMDKRFFVKDTESDDARDPVEAFEENDEHYEEPFMAPSYMRFTGDNSATEPASKAPGVKSDDGRMYKGNTKSTDDGVKTTKHSGKDKTKDRGKTRSKTEDSTKTHTKDASTKTPSSGKGSKGRKHSGDDSTKTASPASKKTKSPDKHSGKDDASKSRTKVEDATKTASSKSKGSKDAKSTEKDGSRKSARDFTVHQSAVTFKKPQPKVGKTHLGLSPDTSSPRLAKASAQAVPKDADSNKVKPTSRSELSKNKVGPFTSPLRKREQLLSLRAAAPFNSAVINRSKWTVACDSAQTGDECKNAIDGNGDTFWHTEWEEGNPPPPHSITVDLKKVYNVNGVSVLPRQDDSSNGNIGQHQVLLSKDNKNWGSPVAYGTWYSDRTVKYANFDTQPARYVRLVAITEVYGNPWTSIAEINVFQANDYMPPQPSMGAWGPTVNFPIIPVAGTVDPITGKVIVWSSWARDTMDGGPGGLTLTSTWDPATGLVTERQVEETSHDMFCPGISLDGNGQLVVTGGNNAERTSLYDPVKEVWAPGPDMKVARGYQSSATTSTGKVFTIGGSWSGGQSFKNGEVYDPKKKTWTMLSKADVTKMLTNDVQGLFRSDNHAWLFGWKSGTVFQAGPSTAMNWYYTDKDGSTTPAGQRGSDRGVAADAMCGNAVMFDAVKGKILTNGGTPNYQDSDATADAHIVTIGNPGTKASVSYASEGLFYPRVFHSSVLLPNGNVFITGGQQYAIPFADSTPQLQPEMYMSESDHFELMRPNNIVRTYHSIGFLLPDGRVFNGGGGLCGGCDTNHFDAQLYSPPYLYDSKGKLAARPKMVSVSAKTIKVGGTVTVQASGPIAQASLVRYGTATHAVNTDQRRVPLTLKAAGKNSYSFQVPSDAGVALPGYWMLFVMDVKGVPSVATTIKITGS